MVPAKHFLGAGAWLGFECPSWAFRERANIGRFLPLLPQQSSVSRREVLWFQKTAQEVIRVPPHPAHRHIAAGLQSPHVQPDGHVAEFCSLELVDVALAGPGST